MPVALGVFLMIVMLTWRRGTRILFEKTRRLEVPLLDLVGSLEKKPPPRVPGTAVFLTGDPTSTPTALLHSLKHYKVLHEHNVVLTIMTADTPRVASAERVQFEAVSDTFARMTVRYGFAESPNLPKALAIARKQGWTFDIMSTSFFLSRRSVRASKDSGMPLWQDKLFIALARNADDASQLFPDPDRPRRRDRHAGHGLIDPACRPGYGIACRKGPSGVDLRVSPAENSELMTIHLIKLCVGCDSIEDLAEWIEWRLGEARKAKQKAEHCPRHADDAETGRRSPRRRFTLLGDQGQRPGPPAAHRRPALRRRGRHPPLPAGARAETRADRVAAEAPVPGLALPRAEGRPGRSRRGRGGDDLPPALRAELAELGLR